MFRLQLIIGPMFAGKTTTLIQMATNLNNKTTLIIKHSSHTRDGMKIKAHTEEGKEEKEERKEEIKLPNEMDCLMVEDLWQIEHLLKNVDVVIIDEGQFMPNLLNWIVEKLDKTHVCFIVAGLTSDYKREPIGELLQLIPHADNVVHLLSFCEHCPEKALYTHRKTTQKGLQQVIMMEGTDISYHPVCRKHFVELNKKIE